MRVEHLSQEPEIIVHFFTYSGDAYLIKENVQCLQMSLPGVRVVIVDDGHDPCPEPVRWELERAGVEWRISSWNRNRNLRGREAILGTVDEMLSSAWYPGDVVVKIDPDTVLLDGACLKEFAAGDKILWGSASENCLMHGCAYAVRTCALARARKVLRVKEFSPLDPDDCSIAEALMYLYRESGLMDLSHPYSAEHRDSIWAGYNWSCYPRIDFYLRFSVVVTGNRPLPPQTRANRLEIIRALRQGTEKRRDQGKSIRKADLEVSNHRQ